MIKKIWIALMSFLVFIFCNPLNVAAQKNAGSITINGGVFANTIYSFPNVKEHDFSVKSDNGQRSVTMNNNIKSGGNVDNIMATLIIPNKGVGDYHFSAEANPEKIEMSITVIRSQNDETIFYHSIFSKQGVIKITSVEGKLISGTFEISVQETEPTGNVIKYQVKGNFNAVKVN